MCADLFTYTRRYNLLDDDDNDRNRLENEVEARTPLWKYCNVLFNGQFFY